MIKTTEAAHEVGKTHGVEVAGLCAPLISAGRMPDTAEAFIVVLGRHIGSSARELRAKGMPDQLVQVWMDAAVKAGVARLLELSHIITQPKRSEH